MLRSLATTTPRVLEIGGGSGRDAAFLVQLGCDTTYTDGCDEMVARAVTLHPELAPRARVAAFPLRKDDDLLNERYDIVLCAAVVMHFDDACLERFMCQVATLISAGGYLVLSHSIGHRRNRNNRDANGRVYWERPPVAIDGIFARAGFLAKRVIEDPDGVGRASISWATHVLQKTT